MFDHLQCDVGVLSLRDMQFESPLKAINVY